MVKYFKDWAAIEAYEDPRFDITGLTPAEQELKDAVATGQICILDKNDPATPTDCLPPKPDDWNTPDPTRHIRADVLRFVLLQKVAHGEMTEAGTTLLGAQITGMLDLSDATIPTYCGLIACRFESAIEADGSQFHSNAVFKHSNLPALSAMGTTIKGQLSCEGARFESTSGTALNLQGAQIDESPFLCDVTAASTIDINAATITGHLTCEGARLEAQSGTALNLQRAQIGGHLFLSNVTAASAIDIMGATIKGQLDCEGAQFKATSGKALDLQEAQIGGGFYFRKVQAVKGRITLNAAQASTIFDDAASWALVDDLILDGFRYDSSSGDTKPSLSERMDWLEKGSIFNGEFRPQPYTQLAETYKRAGHDREARDVRVALGEKLHLQYLNEVKKSLAAPSVHNETLAHLFGWPLVQALNGMNWLFKSVVGYGFKPARSVGWLLGMICILTLLSFANWQTGGFTPNSAPILVSDDWKYFAPLDDAAAQWSATGAAGQDWETFNSFAYAADIVIPIVEIGQTSAWAPSKERGPWGWTLWWARWVFTAAGWIISALGAAAITGVIRRE